MTRPRAYFLAVAAAVLVLGGCSPGGSAPPSAGPVPPATPSGWAYGPSSAPVESPAAATFRDASALAGRTWDGGYDIDEVTFRFVRHTPACDVRYVDPPVADEASGDPVRIEGTAFLRVSCRPVTDLLDRTDRYGSPATTNVTEIVRTGYDGSTLTWAIGLRRRAPFAVSQIMPGSRESGVGVSIVQ